MISGKRILVTGGAGFIGSHLVQALQKTNSITVLDDFSTGSDENLEGSRVERVLRGSVADEAMVADAAKGVDLIFHLGAQVGNILSIERPRDDLLTNVMGTLNVIRAAINERAKLVYSSSSAIYGTPRQLPIDEDHPALPESPYGASKLAAERYCLSYAACSDLRVVCLRYFNVFGPRQGSTDYGNVIPIFFRRLAKGEPLRIFGDGQQTRDFVHVSDVVQANLLAASRPEMERQAFNVATGRSSTVLGLAQDISDAWGASLDVVHEPERAGEVRDSVADIGRIRKHGFEPTVSLLEGLRQMAPLYRR